MAPLLVASVVSLVGVTGYGHYYYHLVEAGGRSADGDHGGITTNDACSRKEVFPLL
jgi:hypothetical protein